MVKTEKVVSPKWKEKLINTLSSLGLIKDKDNCQINIGVNDGGIRFVEKTEESPLKTVFK